ncbi:translation initiation factor IF-2-like [Trachypithecus francoisi]|uniref:translation initiation factor IF-2-like n=1 Tax=Trachypithecus francoisi TaxID=54180 RepID=UPI00141BDDB8|nr:translation initiation factor IF-2-like [Trachypithecus francoisi]XP_033035837.1 translation initiation factor IF-2-like [Trachypithecus francoisi]
MIFIRLKTSSQMVNRVERNELESYTESARDTAPRPGRAGGGRRFPTLGGGTPKRRGTQVSTSLTRTPGVGALRPSPTRPAQAAAWPGDPAPGQGELGRTSSTGQPTPRNHVKSAPSACFSPRKFPTDARSQGESPRAARRGAVPRDRAQQKPGPQPLLLAFLFQFSPDLRWN